MWGGKKSVGKNPKKIFGWKKEENDIRGKLNINNGDGKIDVLSFFSDVV